MNKGKFLKKYTKQMTSIMLTLNPTWDKKEVEKEIELMIDESCTNPEVVLDNNYTGESRESTLLSVLDWVLDRKPIIAGNGTFYKNQHEAFNPIAKMLENFLAKRKYYKKLMFGVKDVRDPRYSDFDRKQLNEKTRTNSYYGASGMPSSPFFSKWSGPATTLTAQSVISTAETLFEGFIADNYLFLDINELIEWTESALKNHPFDCVIDDFVRMHSVNDVLYRQLDKIMLKDDCDEDIYRNYLESLSDSQLSVLYYKNNLQEFIGDHQEIKDLILDVFENIENLDYADSKDEFWFKHCVPEKYQDDFRNAEADEWNSFVNNQLFMDPNKAPKEIKPELQQLKDYMREYVYCQYLSVDRIYRLKNFKRRVVTVIDTDSNILSIDTIINFIRDNVIKGNSFGRTPDENKFISVNMIAYILTDIIEDGLLYYGEKANIPEEFRPIFNMKNEFYFDRLFIGERKKRYISRIRLREGNLFNPPKSDVKGFDFKKSSTSEQAEERFMGILKKYLLDADEIDLRPVLKEVNKFKNDIMESIKSGDHTYLPNGSVKDFAAYKNPYSVQAVKAAYAWNILNPDSLIEPPEKVSIAKLNIMKPSDIKDLESVNKEAYDIIMDKVFNDDTGIFVKKTWIDDTIRIVNPKKKDWYEDIPKKYRTKYKKLGVTAWNEFAEEYLENNSETSNGHWEYDVKGMQSIAIPSNQVIPEYLLPYVDYATVINTILSPFKPVLAILKARTLEEGKTVNGANRKTKAVTNIVKF